MRKNKTISILYVRVSSLDQRTDRQRVNEKDFDKIIEDKCSGAIPIFERPGGSELKMLIDNKLVKSISFYSIDRCNRDLRGILDFIHYTSTVNKVPINFISQGLTTVDENTGEENPISKMMISILGIVAEMERKLILERQREGIALAKLRNAYTGRAIGSHEDPLQFLSKPKNKKAMELLKKGTYKNVEVAKITGLHVNSITKIRKVMQSIE